MAQGQNRLRVPVVLLLQGLFGCLPWGVVQTYINDYLHQQKGLSVELATTVLTVFGVGCAFGVIVGGTAGQALYNWWVPRGTCTPTS
jgi:predicted MFS family arabinose efflux permease